MCSTNVVLITHIIDVVDNYFQGISWDFCFLSWTLWQWIMTNLHVHIIVACVWSVHWAFMQWVNHHNITMLFQRRIFSYEEWCSWTISWISTILYSYPIATVRGQIIDRSFCMVNDPTCGAWTTWKFPCQCMDETPLCDFIMTKSLFDTEHLSIIFSIKSDCFWNLHSLLMLMILKTKLKGFPMWRDISEWAAVILDWNNTKCI